MARAGERGSESFTPQNLGARRQMRKHNVSLRKSEYSEEERHGGAVRIGQVTRGRISGIERGI